jgi:hypothetical protein
LRGGGGSDEELVAFHVEVLELHVLRVHEIQYGLVLQLELLEQILRH